MGIYALEQKFFGGRGFGKIPFLKKVKKFVFSKIQPDVVEVYGLKLHLDTAAGFLDAGTYKESVLEVLKRELKTGDTVLDIGANIGYFTCLMAKMVGEGGKVFAFEPDPGNLNLLRKNVAGNNLHNSVTVIPLAVSDEAGKSLLFPSGVHSSLGFDPFRVVIDRGEAVTVSAMTLDEFFNNSFPKINLIKMDVIGSEARALKGMRELLRKNKTIIILSAFCPAFLEKAGTGGEDYLRALTGLGFKLYDITKEEEKLISPSEEAAFTLKYSPRGKIAQAELLCVR